MSERSIKIKQLQCISCKLWSDKHGVQITTGQRAEEHHLNSGGHAGQKRRGDDFSIPLCPWHHKGDPPYRLSASVAASVYGPSFARSSKAFREIFGQDDALLDITNQMIQNLI